jgi:Kef-type K+ transport system membrane component KefB
MCRPHKLDGTVKNARNVAILLLIALAIVALPGGGDTAALVGAVLSLLIVSLLAYIAGRFYREHQFDLYSLHDHDRAILYVALGAIVLVLAWWHFGTTGGALLSLALLAACVGGLIRVYRNWQRY